uniref:protein mono-ADP-ribosyltransferase PARP14-like n=1 Tax=Myxine glutinosa TaxID=7769 RepID=UPI00358F611B
MSCPEDGNPEARRLLVEIEPSIPHSLPNKLQIYLQSHIRSKGGDCEIRWNADKTNAIVTFNKLKDAESVLGGKSHSIMVESWNVELKVSRYVGEMDEHDEYSKSGAKGGSTTEKYNEDELEGTSVPKQKGTPRGDSDARHDSEKRSTKIESNKSKEQNSSQLTHQQHPIVGHSSEMSSPRRVQKDLTDVSSSNHTLCFVCGNVSAGSAFNFERVCGNCSQTDIGRITQSTQSARKESTRKREKEDVHTFQFYGKVDLPGNRTLRLVHGDILEQHVDVIVNVANEDLNHVEGLALNMVNKGGDIIQEESNTITQNHGPIQKGSLGITGAGKLHCQKIFHVVVPKWSEHNALRRGQELLLMDAVKRALQMADTYNYMSIAIPAIGSGTFGFPLQKCADTIVAAIKVYCEETQNNQVHTKEICIVIDDEKSVFAFEDAMRNCAKSGFNHGRSLDTLENASHLFQKGKGDFNSEAEYPQIDGDGHLVELSQDIERVIKGTKIVYRCGDILNEKVEVIVNMTAAKMDLKKMRISNRLLAKVGEKLQTEIDRQLKWPADNTIIKVDVKDMKLNCKEIYNVDVPQGEQRTVFEGWQTLLRKCLQSASQNGVRSIAFPLLPSEELPSPSYFSDNDILTTTSEFVTSHPHISLKEIYLISESTNRQLKGKTDNVAGKGSLQPGALNQDEGNALVLFQRMGFSQSNPKRRKMMTNKCSFTTGCLDAEQNMTEQYDTRDFGRETTSDSPADCYDPRLSTKSACNVPLPGNCTLTVINDDILKLKVDVVVNAANESLLHHGGLAWAIVKQGGHTIQDESNLIVNKSGPIKTGSMAITGPGNLSCKKIFHVVGPIWREHNVIKEGERIAVSLLKEGVETALCETDKHQYKSIAIPAISSGIFGFPLRKCAETIVAAIRAYCEETKKIRKKEVHIYIADKNKEVIAEVCHAINEDTRPCKNQSPSHSKELVNTHHSDNLKSRNNSASSSPTMRSDSMSSSDGASMYSNDGASMYSSDGASMYSSDGASMYSSDGASMYSNDGARGSNGPLASPTSRNDFPTSAITVKNILGDITQQDSDAIVNSTDPEMKVQGVSAAILRRAGGSVRQEFLSSKLETFSSGCQYIRWTKGGYLKCRVIVHIVGLHHDKYVVALVVADVLRICNQNNIRSVSFPLLGTGIGGMKPEEVHRSMVRGIEKFKNGFKKSSIQLINIVYFDSAKK